LEDTLAHTPNHLDLIDRLISLGLNAREAKLYYALLQKPEATAAMLHRISGVPRTKTYEAIERMVANGLCIERVDGRQRYFRAVQPSVVSDILLERWDRERKRKRQIAGDLFSSLEDLYQSKREEDRSLDFIEVIRSRDQINRRYISLVDGSQSEILAFVRSPFAWITPDGGDEQRDSEVGAGARGVVQRSIYMQEDESRDWMTETLAAATEAGEEIRISKDLPIKMFVFDGRKVLLGLPSIPGLTGSDFTMIVVEDKGLCRVCQELFEIYWDRASVIDQEQKAQAETADRFR
jgi:sugar-specific transcriptional regulator TrmB